VSIAWSASNGCPRSRSVYERGAPWVGGWVVINRSDTDIVGPGEIRVRDRLGEEGYPTWSAIDSRTTAVHRPRQATHSRRPSIARPRSVVVLDEVREGECPRRAFSLGALHP
jgi:hypothetical protein